MTKGVDKIMKDPEIIEAGRLAWNEISNRLGMGTEFDTTEDFKELYTVLVKKLLEEENADV